MRTSVGLKHSFHILLKCRPHILRQTERWPHILEPLKCRSCVWCGPRVIEKCGTRILDRNTVLALLERKAGIDLAFWNCRTDYLCRVFKLLSMSTAPSSMFSTTVQPYGLLETPGNLELHILKRRTTKLVFTIFDHMQVSWETLSRVAWVVREVFRTSWGVAPHVL